MPQHTIMIVDDNLQLIDSLNFALTTLTSYTVETAHNGLEGLEKIQSLLPDCAIIDVVMPKMNGYTLISTLRQTPTTAHIPLIILSALAQQEDQRIGYLAGADLYLTKPIDPKSLISHIEQLLQQR